LKNCSVNTIIGKKVLKVGLHLGKIGAMELVLILAIALIIFGPAKLPEIGKSIGEAVGQFKSHANKISQDLDADSKAEKQS
jgi:sec-independent protein translocase protein TatA